MLNRWHLFENSSYSLKKGVIIKVALFSVYKNIPKICTFRWKIKFHIENRQFSWISPSKSTKRANFVQNSSNKLKKRIFWLSLSIVVEVNKFWMKTIDFSRKRNCTELETLATIVANSSKIHRIRSKNASLDSKFRSTSIYQKLLSFV